MIPSPPMDSIHLLLDLASPSSLGGELLKVELARALGRTCPVGSSISALRHVDQGGLKNLPGLSTHTTTAVSSPGSRR